MKKYRFLLSLAVICLAAVLWTFHFERSEQEEGNFETANGRYEWRLMMRGGSWEPEKVLAAKEYLKQHQLPSEKNHKRDAGLNEWTELGPGNYSGRVRAIAVHPSDPDIIFAGGVSGGIWKTTNAGTTWTSLNDFLPSLSVTCILIHPTSPDTMYVSTGEAFTTGTAPGAGIFKSTNGGNTWNLISALDPDNLTGYYWINKLVFHPSDRTILFAAAGGSFQNSPGGCGEIYKITGSGGQIFDLGASNICAGTGISVAVSGSDPNRIYGSFSGGLVVSSNGGITWDLQDVSEGFIANPGRVEIAIDPANQSRVYALCQNPSTLSGYLLKSIDAGESWTTVNPVLPIFDPGNGKNQGWYDNVVWVDPTNADIIIIGGVDLWRSTNGGTSFLPISDGPEYYNGLSAHADQHIIVAASDYGPTNKKVYIGNDGGIVSTDNIATASVTVGWNILNGNTFGTTQFYASGTEGQNPNKLIGGSQDNGILMSIDNGTTWTHEIGGDGGYCGFSPTSDLIYASTQLGRFYVHGLGALIGWHPFEDLDVIDTSLFIAPMRIFPNDGNKVLMGGEHLWYRDINGPGSIDVGPASVTNRFISAIDIAADSSLVVIGYSSGEIYKAVPGVWSWTPLPIAITNCFWSGPVTDIAIHPMDFNRIMVSRGGYQDCNIAYTNNAGASWESRSDGIPALHVNCLTWHPDIGNWLYAGTDLGVMASEDNGQNWNVMGNFGTSDGPAFVEVTEISFAWASVFGTRTMTATTYGRGIWKTSTAVREDIYVDEDCVNCEVGTQSFPYKTVSEADSAQAHGQNWTFDAGTYPVPTNNKVVIDKKIGEIKTPNGAVIIGQN
ncbi:MAG: hypothetical protein IPL46_14610 [Saprospiraceae bacterium]|nr:hypothetical protein [Saprospiraceae bacterium]